MIEILQAKSDRKSVLPIRTMATTDWICHRLKCTNETLETIGLSQTRFLAWDRMGFTKRLPVNEQATKLLNQTRPGPLKVYGDAIVFYESDIREEKEAISEKVG